jgi:hypothetical protein
MARRRAGRKAIRQKRRAPCGAQVWRNYHDAETASGEACRWRAPRPIDVPAYGAGSWPAAEINGCMLVADLGRIWAKRKFTQ